MSKLPQFSSLEEAFSYCREKDQPTRVLVHGQRFKVYPSGRAEEVSPAASTSDATTTDVAARNTEYDTTCANPGCVIKDRWHHGNCDVPAARKDKE